MAETLQAFTLDLAELLDVPSESIDPDARLVEDLGLDSVALAEMIVILITDYGAEELAARLEFERWENRSVREVVSMFCEPGVADGGNGTMTSGSGGGRAGR